jgi:hypothetical protein
MASVPSTNPVVIATARVNTLTAQVATSRARIQDFQALAAENDTAALTLADKVADALTASQPTDRLSEAKEKCRIREADLKLALDKLPSTSSSRASRPGRMF